MTLLPLGQKFKYKNRNYKIYGFGPTGYYIREYDSYLTYPEFFITFEDVVNGLNDKTLKLLDVDPDCDHNWKRYMGLKKVEDYCTKCNKTLPVDWRKLK